MENNLINIINKLSRNNCLYIINSLYLKYNNDTMFSIKNKVENNIKLNDFELLYIKYFLSDDEYELFINFPYDIINNFNKLNI